MSSVTAISETNLPYWADFSMVTGLSAILIRLFVSIMLISVPLSNPIPKSEILPSTWSILLPVAPSTTMLRAPSLMASLMAYSVSVSSFMGLSLCISVCPFLSKNSNAFVVAESKSPTIISGVTPFSYRKSIPLSAAIMASIPSVFISFKPNSLSIFPPHTIKYLILSTFL